MNRENKYTIEVFFTSTQSRNIYSGAVPYYGSTIFRDSFSISQNKITIEANRSAVIQLDSIFFNHFSSIYNQLMKSLLFYYATVKKFSQISLIEIKRERNGKILDSKQIKNTQFNQILSTVYNLSYTINPARLEELFQESPKGTSTLVAISYILKANSGLSESEKFEKLWKAFNKLYILIGQHTQDFTCLRNLRTFILNHPGILPLSSAKVSNLSTDKFRNSIRWRIMLLDVFPSSAHATAFRDFALRYNDKRIMEILLQTNYGYREDILKNAGHFNVVDNHIQNAIAQNVVDDSEIIAFLTGKYMYFVRNKTFHGEKIDSSFRLVANKEDKELKFLNNILEPYLIDLINANNLY